MYNESKKNASIKYKREKMKRIPFDLRLEGEGLTYPLLKEAADSAGVPVSAFMKEAILEKIERMGL